MKTLLLTIMLLIPTLGSILTPAAEAAEVYVSLSGSYETSLFISNGGQAIKTPQEVRIEAKKNAFDFLNQRCAREYHGVLFKRACIAKSNEHYSVMASDPNQFVDQSMSIEISMDAYCKTDSQNVGFFNFNTVKQDKNLIQFKDCLAVYSNK